MSRLLIAIVIAFSASFAMTDDCSGGWRKHRTARRPVHRKSATRSTIPNRHAHPYTPEDHYRAMYPKYYGGFRTRELQNIGIPSSDIGLRGNGLYWTPW